MTVSGLRRFRCCHTWNERIWQMQRFGYRNRYDGNSHDSWTRLAYDAEEQGDKVAVIQFIILLKMAKKVAITLAKQLGD